MFTNRRCIKTERAGTGQPPVYT